MHVFYNILDIAGINAWVLHNEITQNKLKRKAFLLQLALELRGESAKIEKETLEAAGPSNPCKKRKKCQITGCKGNKTSDSCTYCTKAVCGKCTKEVSKRCKECAQ